MKIQKFMVGVNMLKNMGMDMKYIILIIEKVRFRDMLSQMARIILKD